MGTARAESARRAKELWATTPLADRPLWTVFWRKRVNLARRRPVRKYLNPRGDWTEDRFKAVKFDNEDVARGYAERLTKKTGEEWLVDRWKP